MLDDAAAKRGGVIKTIPPSRPVFQGVRVIRNQALEELIAVVAQIVHDQGGETRYGGLQIFGELMGGVTKQAVHHWLATGGVPRSKAAALRAVLRDHGLPRSEGRIEALLKGDTRAPAAGRRKNAALAQICAKTRQRGYSMGHLAAQLGITRWQLMRCYANYGGLPSALVPTLRNALLLLDVDVAPALVAGSARDAGAALPPDNQARAA